eukprot:1646226-Lingulodinium_polyedra.AAC.1
MSIQASTPTCTVPCTSTSRPMNRRMDTQSCQSCQPISSFQGAHRNPTPMLPHRMPARSV